MAVKVLFTFYTLNAIVHSSKKASWKGTVRDRQNDKMTYKGQNRMRFTHYRETKRWSDEKCSPFVIVLFFPQLNAVTYWPSKRN